MERQWGRSGQRARLDRLLASSLVLSRRCSCLSGVLLFLALLCVLVAVASLRRGDDRGTRGGVEDESEAAAATAQRSFVSSLSLSRHLCSFGWFASSRLPLASARPLLGLAADTGLLRASTSPRLASPRSAAPVASLFLPCRSLDAAAAPLLHPSSSEQHRSATTKKASSRAQQANGLKEGLLERERAPERREAEAGR